MDLLKTIRVNFFLQPLSGSRACLISIHPPISTGLFKSHCAEHVLQCFALQNMLSTMTFEKPCRNGWVNRDETRTGSRQRLQKEVNPYSFQKIHVLRCKLIKIT